MKEVRARGAAGTTTRVHAARARDGQPAGARDALENRRCFCLVH